MRRRSEICQFNFEDLQHLGNHKHALLLRPSKPDQYNQGKTIPISGELSGHSFRVGAALDLLDKKIPLEKIMLRGGWKSEASAMRYLQSLSDQDWLIVPSHHS